MRIFFRYLSLFFLLLFPLAFAGCGDAPKTGEEKEIVLAAGRDLSPGEKDPYYSTVILHLSTKIGHETKKIRHKN